MLAKQYRITRNEDFSYVIKNGMKKKFPWCVVYIVSRETANSFSVRVGFIVSKKIGNAVTRNLIKRRLREVIADFLEIRFVSATSIDIVVRALPASVRCSYGEMESAVHGFLEEFVSRKSIPG